MLVAVMVLYWFMGMWKKRDKEGGVVDIFMDLFVLMGVYLSSSWIMDATQRGSVGDILIMLACTASIARMVLEHLF
jgi:heme/copper-type cytochrome/quinol oxidase subunit 4